MKRYSITVNGKAYDVMVEEVAAGAPAPVAAPAPAPAAPAAAPAPTPAPAPVAAPAAAPADGIKVSAPMPGTILDVKVSVGQTVSKGDALVILEAMKMENDIVAPEDGKVAAVSVKKGDSVNSGDLMVVLA